MISAVTTTDIPMAVELYNHQLDAIEKMHNGCILCGGVGTGKSRTALAYYILKQCKGSLVVNGEGSLGEMKAPRDLYIITTAKKRDSGEWLKECGPFCLSFHQETNLSNVKVTIDSWNNISKYRRAIGAFFIFDEQRVVGSGAWVKAFLDISRKNKWILLSATPGDVWSDYIPVFVANGFYRNKTEFLRKHAVFNRFSKYPKIDRYVDISRLEDLRSNVLVNMYYERQTVPHHEDILVKYNREKYNRVSKERWDIFEDKPIKETGKLFYLMRKVVNSDYSRYDAVCKLAFCTPRVIIFYNFDYELELLRIMCDEIQKPYSEWNGQKHEPVPDGESWAYLVQYSAGAEGWNCVTTDTIIFYSQNYSYRMMTQAAGRIDRLNTKYKDLYFYHLVSNAPIDQAIKRALSRKKNFNEKSFLERSSL